RAAVAQHRKRWASIARFSTALGFLTALRPMSSPVHARTSCAVTPKTSNGSCQQLLHALAGAFATTPTLHFSHQYNPQRGHLYSLFFVQKPASTAPGVDHGDYSTADHDELNEERQAEPVPREQVVGKPLRNPRL